jgi:glycogen debranching enzyme
MQLPSYRYPFASLYTGSSLGNALAFARFTAATDCDGLWSASDNRFYLGLWRVEFERDGMLLPPEETVFNPESQSTIYRTGNVTAQKEFFIPFDLPAGAADVSQVLKSLHCRLSLCNTEERDAILLIRHRFTFPAVPSAVFTKQPSEEDCDIQVSAASDGNRWIITTQGRPGEVRIVNSELVAAASAADSTRLTAEYRIMLKPGETKVIPFQMAFSSGGVESIPPETFETERLLASSRESYRTLLGRTDIRTPDPLINRGLQWAKINTVRVQHLFRSGWGFTNDPPQDIVVIRDLAWYVLGSDYLTPGFSRGLLKLAERHAYHDGGKLTEYIHADEESPEKHDYALNINDDTPLYCYALAHHAAVVCDDMTPHRIYPLMKKACDWILGQRGPDGCVVCTATGTNVWGICGWRNIIDGYTLSGAVTEINAECWYALEATAATAEVTGDAEGAAFYRREAGKLKAAVNTKLLSEKTGVYLLNRTLDGTPRHDLTGDLVFSLMFGIAPEDLRRKILDVLGGPEFWADYGSRTVARTEANYDPDFGYQLVGGLWPNLMAWTAFCFRKDDPERVADALRRCYRMSETGRPADFVNCVPGEFPERLHGETGVSRGMAMSPWMPPTYLWLGVEGLLGLNPKAKNIAVEPSIPSSWNWLAVRNLLYRGQAVNIFIVDGVMYSTHPLESPLPVVTGTSVPASANGPFCMALETGGDVLLFTVSSTPWEGDVEIHVHNRTKKIHCTLSPDQARLVKVPVTSNVREKRR